MVAKISIDAPRPQKAKTVRIISPHTSTSEHDPTFRQFPDQAVSRYDRSPSPASEFDGEPLEGTLLVDPFDVESDPDGETTSEDEENLRRNTRGNSGYIQITNDIVPPNPFRKTIVSQEPTSAVRRKEGQNSSSAAIARPLYDVNEFKRLLLTGEKIVSHTNNLSTTAIVTPDSSSTDASSISRQSIFEPPRGNHHQDTPRTSEEVSPSSAERTGVEEKPFISAGNVKPSTPEHRHGKPVTATVQQTASLGKDTKLGIKTNSSFKSEASNIYTSPVSPWTPKDLNKPLPPPPVSPGLPPPQDTTTIDLVTDNQRHNTQLNDLQAPVSRSPSSKSRPAPPPSRRQSLLRPNPLLENPEQRFSISENSFDPSTSKPSTSISKPPPPPPRRHIKARGLSVSSANSAISATPSTPTDDMPPNSSKSRPPPLPPTRTPSVSSYKRPTRILTNPNSPSMASPPAPPPRQRGSSQSSISKPSDVLVTKFESEAHTSNVPGVDILLIPPPAAITSTVAPEVGLGLGGAKDVMADLSALQRDVDELRKKFND